MKNNQKNKGVVQIGSLHYTLNTNLPREDLYSAIIELQRKLNSREIEYVNLQTRYEFQEIENRTLKRTIEALTYMKKKH